ncbi:hypothetical protein WR25_07731 isoform B [Diploscapter pachys]|uniref:Uncharacterized protein n=1 Tax=Diploscapter pachys TaxID=2018661 RepID=A0A2A2KYL4_9BILA|nr:hypothetical protein WR25_07731 isoform B [Diploscapter pachys]
MRKKILGKNASIGFEIGHLIPHFLSRSNDESLLILQNIEVNQYMGRLFEHRLCENLRSLIKNKRPNDRMTMEIVAELLYPNYNNSEESFVPEFILYAYRIHQLGKGSYEIVFSLPNPYSVFRSEYQQKSTYFINPILKLANSPEKNTYFSLLPKKEANFHLPHYCFICEKSVYYLMNHFLM